MIISGLIYMGAALTGFVVALRGLEMLFSTPTKTLKLTIFRPYRGDSWPQGVQEEDGVHFDLTGPKPPAPPIVPAWDEIVANSTPDVAATDVLSEAAIEETTKESVVVQPLHGEVHRAPH